MLAYTHEGFFLQLEPPEINRGEELQVKREGHLGSLPWCFHF